MFESWNPSLQGDTYNYKNALVTSQFRVDDFHKSRGDKVSISTDNKKVIRNYYTIVVKILVNLTKSEMLELASSNKAALLKCVSAYCFNQIQ